MVELCRTVIEVVETSLVAFFSCSASENKLTSAVAATVHSSEGLRTTVTLELVSAGQCQQEQFRALVVQRPRVKEFLSDGAAAMQIEDVKGDICSGSEGSRQGLVLTLKPTAALSGDSVQTLVDRLRCHFHTLHLTHPWICFEIKESCPANKTFKCWSYPEAGINCKTAKVGRRHKIATCDMHYSDSRDTTKCAHVQPVTGSHYSLRRRWAGDGPCDCHVSACVFTVPHLRLAKRHKQKRLPADYFLAHVKRVLLHFLINGEQKCYEVLAYGPGGLPVWYESVDSQHMTDCVAEWRQFGVTLVPSNEASDGEGGCYDVHSEREDSRSADHGKRRLLVLMLFLDLPESHSAVSKLSFVDGLRTRAGDVLTHCSSRLKLACHSALNKLLFNYSREAELTSALSEALPSLSSAVSTIITKSENEEFKANCFKLLKVEDDTKGGQDELSACILQCLQKLAKRSVTFAKATPPQAKRDGDGASVCATPVESQSQVHQNEAFRTKVQSQANKTQSSSNGVSSDRLEGTPKAFKSYLCNRYARKRAQESEATCNDTATKLTEGAPSRQSCKGLVTTVADDEQHECKASKQTDFDDLEGWAHHQSPNVLAVRSNHPVGLVQRPCMEISPATSEDPSQSVLLPLHGPPSEQDVPLPAPAGSLSPPDNSIPDWDDDLDTLLFEEDGSVCSYSDEMDVPLSPGDLTFSSELDMDTDTEGEESELLRLTQECGSATEDPLKINTTLDLPICGSAAPDAKTPECVVPEAATTVLDDFDCLDDYAFFDEGESEAILNRHTQAKDHTTHNCTGVRNTQWSEFDDIQENDFQW